MSKTAVHPTETTVGWRRSVVSGRCGGGEPKSDDSELSYWRRGEAGGARAYALLPFGYCLAIVAGWVSHSVADMMTPAD